MILSLTEHILELAVQIQQIPAPTFQEGKRAEFVRTRFLQEGLSDVSMDSLGNVYARLPARMGSRTTLLARPVVLSAHLDTVFPASTDLHLERGDGRLAGPGIGDNSLGVAGLFGTIWALRSRRIELPGDLWLVANVGEEGLGNLRGIRALVERFEALKPSAPLAYLILEGMALGQIYHRGLGVERRRISVDTPGGHSWVDYGKPSAIHALAGLASRLVTLPLPSEPRTTLNAGVISGGTTVNTIAAHAHLELDLRSEGEHELAWLVGQVHELAQAVEKDHLHVTVETIGQRPAGEISPNHPLVRLVSRALEAQGIQPRLNAGSTDANLPLSLGLPAVCLGLTNGSGAHTHGESIYTAPLAQGMEQVVWILERVHKELA